MLFRNIQQIPDKGVKFFKKLELVTLTLISLVSVLYLPNALANPQGGSVSAGSASISSASNTLTIDQTTGKAVINWQSFNIAPSETTQFNQPSPSAIALNRVSAAQGSSQIAGSLKANGQIWLINPAGVVFTKDAHVDVAGLLVSTANISDDDFMKGNYRFQQAPGVNGSVVNNGNIHIADGGG